MHTVSGFGANTTQSQRRQQKQTNKHTKWPADPKAHIHKIRTTFDNLTCKVVFK